MTSYMALAGFYDKLMRDIDYGAVAEYYEEAIRQQGAASVLDAACGTGTVAAALASKGYDVIAADVSPEMLSVAYEKLSAVSCEKPPLLLNQSLAELDLYGTVDSAICTLDGLNYLSPEELTAAVGRIFLFLEPGGIFVFDVNTPEKFADMDGMTYSDEADDVYCVWKTALTPDRKACVYSVDIFSKGRGNSWSREYEEHTEYLYGESELKEILASAGFEAVETCPAPWDKGFDGKIYRLCFKARKPGKIREN